VNKQQILKELSEAGVKKDMIILLHSSLSSIHDVEGGAETVIESFLELLGTGGTLCVPAFGGLGVISDVLSARKDAVLSNSPKGRIAAIGADAEKICAGHLDAVTAHGSGTPYYTISELNGYVLLLGVDHDRNTSLHTVEALLELPYLDTITEQVTAETGVIQKTWKFYPGPHRDFIGLDKKLFNSGKMRVGKVGFAVTRLIKSRDLIDICLELGKKDPAWGLCRNPSCLDCAFQRAAIFRSIICKETFSLTASSVLAGTYIPEIVHNLKKCGIDNVELDYLERKPVLSAVDAKTIHSLREAVSTFISSGIRISGVRLSAIPAEPGPFIKAVKTCGAGRIIMPLSGSVSYMKSAVQIAGTEKIKISFYNTGMSGAYAADTFKNICNVQREAPVRTESESDVPGFSFAPADFAASGEKPFLETYRAGKFNKFIDQLYVEDGTFAGLAKPLAQGNAEIKEIISILRCRSFNGLFCLSSRNRVYDTINLCVADFQTLL